MKYLEKYNRHNDNLVVAELKEYASTNNVPIVTDEGLTLIIELIKSGRAKNILEIGTAIGYCAINMALINKNIHIDTIERNEKMYYKALENITKANLNNQIDVIKGDALLVDDALFTKQYDLIFIDAAKAQYIKFFEKYQKFLAADGIIVSDNLLFHGLIEHKEDANSKDLRALLRKLDDYNEWLFDNKEFETSFFTIGDGMAISRRRK